MRPHIHIHMHTPHSALNRHRPVGTSVHDRLGALELRFPDDSVRLKVGGAEPRAAKKGEKRELTHDGRNPTDIPPMALLDRTSACRMLHLARESVVWFPWAFAERA